MRYVYKNIFYEFSKSMFIICKKMSIESISVSELYSKFNMYK